RRRQRSEFAEYPKSGGLHASSADDHAGTARLGQGRSDEPERIKRVRCPGSAKRLRSGGLPTAVRRSGASTEHAPDAGSDRSVRIGARTSQGGGATSTGESDRAREQCLWSLR